MSFISSVLRVLTGAIVLLGASLFLNISGDTGSSEALLAMGAMAKEKCITIGEKRICLEDGANEEKCRVTSDDDDARNLNRRACSRRLDLRDATRHLQ